MLHNSWGNQGKSWVSRRGGGAGGGGAQGGSGGCCDEEVSHPGGGLDEYTWSLKSFELTRSRAWGLNVL